MESLGQPRKAVRDTQQVSQNCKGTINHGNEKKNYEEKSEFFTKILLDDKLCSGEPVFTWKR